MEKIQKVLDSWKAIKDNRELELILKLNNKQKIELYSRLNKLDKKSSSKFIRKSLNTIHSVDKTITNRIEKDISTHEKRWIRKTKKSQEFGMWWKFVASEELPIPEFSAIGADFIRLKYRKSIIHENWKWDFTVVRNVQKNEFSQLKQISNEFFTRDFEDIFFHPNYTLEVEVEWMERADISTENVMDLLNWIRENLGLVDENYMKIIKTLSYKIDNTKRSHRHLKTLASMPITLDRKLWTQLNLQEFYISAKADGIRAWLFGSNGKLNMITDKIQELGEFHGRDFILDCEVLNSGKSQRILAFDCIYYEGKNYIREKLTTRISAIDFLINKYDLNVEVKPVVKIPEKIQDFWKKDHGFPVDGLIFTNIYNYYKVYKWKPPEKMTIDFVAKKDLYSENYILFSGIKLQVYKNMGIKLIENYAKYFSDMPKFYFPVPFQPSSDPHAYIWKPEKQDDYNNKIVELGWNYDKNKWDFHKIREDKQKLLDNKISFGNDFLGAVQIYNSFFNPFTVQDLDNTDLGYFQQSKTSEYKALTKFNAFVKFQLAEQFRNKNIIDLAAGKGQDLFTFHGIGASEILLIDQDKNALDEIDNRKKQLGNSKFYAFRFNPVSDSRVYTMQADLCENYEKIKSRIQRRFDFTADVVFMNFALHYFANSTANLENIVNLVSSLNPRYFIFTCFNGLEIFKTLQGYKMGQVKDMNKYKIRKLYNSDKFSMGLKVAVKHPFSQDLYEEFLVNIDEVISMFISKNYLLTENSSFSSWHKHYHKFSLKNKTPELDKFDKIYSGLYSYVVLEKKLK